MPRINYSNVQYSETHILTYTTLRSSVYFKAGKMSYTIDTNLELNQIPKGFLSDTSEFLSRLFNRPKKVKKKPDDGSFVDATHIFVEFILMTNLY